MYYFTRRVEVLVGEWRSPVKHKPAPPPRQFVARRVGKERQSHGHRSGRMSWFGKLVLSIHRKQMGRGSGWSSAPSNENIGNGRGVSVGSLRWEDMAGILVKCAPHQVWSACPLR